MTFQKSIYCFGLVVALAATGLQARADESVQNALETEWQAATQPNRDQLKLGGYWECSVFRDLGDSDIFKHVFRFLPATKNVYMNEGEYNVTSFGYSGKSLTATQYCDSWKSRKRQIWIRVDEAGNLIAKETENCHGNGRDSWIVGPRTSYFTCPAELVEGNVGAENGGLNP